MKKAILVVIAVCVLAGVGSAYFSRRPAALEPGSYAWQVKKFGQDSEHCSKFAIKREEARELLAWPKKEDAIAKLQTLDADMKAMVICLREIGWPEEQIQRLMPVIQKQRADEFCDYHRKRGTKMPNCGDKS
jgi:hypothetical protein